MPEEPVSDSDKDEQGIPFARATSERVRRREGANGTDVAVIGGSAPLPLLILIQSAEPFSLGISGNREPRSRRSGSKAGPREDRCVDWVPVDTATYRIDTESRI